MTRPEPGPRTLYSADAVFDGVDPRLHPGHGILVGDGRVIATGPVGDLAAAEVPAREFPGRVIVPGFVDAHTHITIRPGEGDQHAQLVGPTAWQTIRGVPNLQRMIESGVTTARIMTERDDIDYEFRDAIARGEITGPRLLVCGPGLSPPGGHGSAGAGVAGVRALREAVRQRAERGADHIKMFTTGGVSSTDTSPMESNYTGEEIAATVDEAKAHGLTVAAHAHGGAGVDLAVANGIHSIEHGSLLSRESMDLMAAHGTWLVLTNTISSHPDGIEAGDARRPEIMSKLREVRAVGARNAPLLRKAGVRIALGTDSMHGLFGYELQWVVEHGWSTADALRFATSAGGQLLGEHDTGVLRPGSRADFVVLRRDPLRDISAVYDIEFVYRAGEQLASPSAGGTT